MARVDRRALFTSGAAAALLAASGLALQAAPRRGGRLRLAVAPESGTLDRLGIAAVFETLTEIGPEGVLKPALARSWQSSADARIWHFALQPEARFHDGRRCDAEAVAAGLQPVLAALDGAAVATATGSRQIEIALAEGDANLPFRLADPRAGIAASGAPATLSGQDVCGTGLYRLQDYRVGRHFVGQRVHPHHRDAEAGWADSVEIIAIPDARVRAEALRDRYVDVAEAPDLAELKLDGSYHPASLTGTRLLARAGVGIPLYARSVDPAEDSRLAERWWMV
jgi:ABC-type transport system substrate-binding protein